MCLRATQKAASPSGQQQSQKTRQEKTMAPTLLGGGSAVWIIVCKTVHNPVKQLSSQLRQTTAAKKSETTLIEHNYTELPSPAH